MGHLDRQRAAVIFRTFGGSKVAGIHGGRPHPGLGERGWNRKALGSANR